MPPSFVSVISNADSGETLLGPASIICSVCNACCHCRICSTPDQPESIDLMRCAVTASSDPAANLFIFCGSPSEIMIDLPLGFPINNIISTCKRGSVGQSEGLSIPRSSVRFRLKPDNSNSHEFSLHRPSNKGTKLLLKVIKAIIIIFADPLLFLPDANLIPLNIQARTLSQSPGL